MYRSGGRCCRRWLNAPIEQSTTACLYSSIWHSSSVYRVHCSGQTPIISDSSKHRATPFCWDFLPSSTLKDRQKSEIRGAIKSPGLFYLGTHLMAVYYWIHGSWHTVVLLLCTRANTQCHTPPSFGTSRFLSRQSTQFVKRECSPDGDLNVGLQLFWAACSLFHSRLL